jgi:hypothetical protein
MPLPDLPIEKVDQLSELLWQELNELFEADFGDYLPMLEDYEERLVRGEIHW